MFRILDALTLGEHTNNRRVRFFVLFASFVGGDIICDMKKRRILFLLGVLAVFGIAVFFAYKFALYYIINWYDIIVHTLGGAVLGVLSTWMLDRWQVGDRRLWHILFAGAAIGLLGGFIVEVGEYNVGSTSTIIDTIIDLLADVVGAALFAWIAIRVIERDVPKTAPESKLPEVYHEELASGDSVNQPKV
jgi:hypothetical protein